MIFSNLPIGTEFCFGKIKKSQYNYNRPGGAEIVDVPMVWKKTALNGLSVGIKECGYASFDYRHSATGSNRYMRNHGHRVFFLSSLYKYLNCADTSWRNVASGDAQPRCDNRDNNGFLSRFTDEEIRLIEPHNMTTAIPVGYNKLYGAEMSKSVLVGIPSLAQIGDRYGNGTFGVGVPRKTTWVHDADTMSQYLNYGSICRVGADTSAEIIPVIKLKDDAPVDVQEDGRFIIRIPESEFAGDLDAFLGFGMEAAA